MRTTDVTSLILGSTIIASNQNPSFLTIPAYRLVIGQGYLVTVRVTSVVASTSLSRGFTAATTQIVVKHGAVVACVQGGGSQLLRVGKSGTLSASCSYDEDLQAAASNMGAQLAGLQFSWQCMQLAPILSANCSAVLLTSAVFDVVTNVSIPIEVKNLDSLVGAVLRVQLTASDRTGQRVAATSVQLTVIATLAVNIALSFSADSLVSSTGVMNAASKLSIQSLISVPPRVHGNWSWSVITSPSVTASPAIASLASTTTSDRIVESTQLEKSSVFFVLPSNSLLPGVTYTFQFAASVIYSTSNDHDHLVSTVAISVMINQPPIPGLFGVTPAVGGTALDTVFTMSTSLWVSTNLPLSFQFGYQTAFSNQVWLTFPSEVPFAMSQLPPGDVSNAYKITCNIVAMDQFSASSELSTSVVSSVSSSLDTSDGRLRYIISDASIVLSRFQVDSSMQSLSVAVGLMNLVNCTSVSVSYCASLNRKPCFRTAHTCGPCNSSDLVGIDGDANGKCVPKDSTSRRMLHGIETNAATRSSTTLMPCPNDCSGHGTCHRYSRRTEQEVLECSSDSLQCYAACVCDSDYAQSVACSEPFSTVDAKIATRTQVIHLVLNVSSSMQPQQQQQNQVVWLDRGPTALLWEAIMQPYEMNERSIALVLAHIQKLLTRVTCRYNPEVLRIVPNMLDALAQSILAQQHWTVVARQSLVATLLDALKQYGEVMGSCLSPGEANLSTQRSYVRMQVARIPPSDAAPSQSQVHCFRDSRNLSIAIPLSAVETHLRLSRSTERVTLPQCLNYSGTSVDRTNVKLSVISLQRSLVIPGADSNSLTVSVHGDTTFALSTQQRLVLTAPWVAPIDFNASQLFGGETHIVSCGGLGDRTRYTLSCALGNNTVSHVCSGEQRRIALRCPTVRTEPSCVRLDDENAVVQFTRDFCDVQDFDVDSVTCLCPLLPGTIAAAHRRLSLLQGNASDDGTNVVRSFGSFAISYVVRVRNRTITYAPVRLDEGPSDVEPELSTIVVLTLLLMIFALCIYGADKLDAHSQKINVQIGDLHNKFNINAIFALEGQAPARGLNDRDYRDPNQILMLAEEALPNILSLKPFWLRLFNELKLHHRWIGVVFYYSPQIPRVMRVISLATNVILIIFIQSITYFFSQIDDGECRAIDNEADCLSVPSVIVPGGSKCYWVSTNAKTLDRGSCNYVDIDMNVKLTLLVAVFSALLSTPGAVAVDWMINHVINRPTANSKAWERAREAQTQGGRVKAARSSMIAAAVAQELRAAERVSVRHSMLLMNNSNAGGLQNAQMKSRTAHLRPRQRFQYVTRLIIQQIQVDKDFQALQYEVRAFYHAMSPSRERDTFKGT